jgi:hypothetical protein
MNDDDFMTDDAKLVMALLRLGHPDTAWGLACRTGLDRVYAERALAHLAEARAMDAGGDWPVRQLRHLGPDVYQAVAYTPQSWSDQR